MILPLLHLVSRLPLFAAGAATALLAHSQVMIPQLLHPMSHLPLAKQLELLLLS